MKKCRYKQVYLPWPPVHPMFPWWKDVQEEQAMSIDFGVPVTNEQKDQVRIKN